MRLINGDAHNELEKLDDDSIDLVLDDPPYNITECEWDQQPLDWQHLWSEMYRIGKPDTAFIFTASNDFTIDLINSNRDDYQYSYTWVKPGAPTNFMNANRMPVRRTEDVLVFYRELSTFNRSAVAHRVSEKMHNDLVTGDDVYEGAGVRNTDSWTKKWSNPIDDVIKAKRDIEHHPTEKPTKLLRQLIRTYTDEGETVLDFTMGSGSTGVAAANEGREFIGVEQDTEYYEVAKERINKAEKKRTQTEKFFEI